MSPYPPLSQITVEELAQRLAQSNDELQLIDVREFHEVEIAYIEGFEILPLSQATQWSEEINTRFNPEIETLVICHHGMRSAQMCYWLLNKGFTNVKNVVGGIDAYSLKVDSSIRQY